MIQAISIFGSLLILSAYIANQFKRLGPSDLLYNLLNLVGSAILATIAVIEQQWGFLLLEGVWALISVWTTLKALQGK
ncbi:MAG: hypothetical protein ABI670_10925 [Chloroflexota bacterium]